jgi:hypothetical protein
MKYIFYFMQKCFVGWLVLRILIRFYLKFMKSKGYNTPIRTKFKLDRGLLYRFTLNTRVIHNFREWICRRTNKTHLLLFHFMYFLQRMYKMRWWYFNIFGHIVSAWMLNYFQIRSYGHPTDCHFPQSPMSGTWHLQVSAVSLLPFIVRPVLEAEKRKI